MKEIFHTYSAEETEKVASAFASNLDKAKPQFIAMYGDLGVGKTAFVRGLASVIAPNSKVKSPTYTVVNEYHGGIIPLYHFDVYRIEDEDDLYSVGFYEYLQKGICVTEWSENIEYSIPKNAHKITIERGSDPEKERIITIEAYEDENTRA